MNPVRITSWNTQGGAFGKIRTVSSIVIPESLDHILLLQESGATDVVGDILEHNKTVQFGNKAIYTGTFARGVDAKNNRCTNGIITSLAMFDARPVYIDDMKRPIMLIELDHDNFHLTIATLHATPNHRIARNDVPVIISFLNTYARSFVTPSRRGHWILMGDFNVSPEELKRYIPEYWDNIINSDQATHDQGSELDYAIVSNELIGILEVECHNSHGSDHRPIYINITQAIIDALNANALQPNAAQGE